MRYYVREEYIATENNRTHAKGTVHINYVGVGGYCSDNPDYIEKWSRRRFAEECIKRDNEWDAEHPDLTPRNWSVTREVVEV